MHERLGGLEEVRVVRMGSRKWKGDLTDLNAFALYSGSRNERNKVDIPGQLAYKLTVVC